MILYALDLGRLSLDDDYFQAIVVIHVDVGRAEDVDEFAVLNIEYLLRQSALVMVVAYRQDTDDGTRAVRPFCFDHDGKPRSRND